MSKSQWIKYDSKILETIKDPENVNLGYSELARLVLGKKAEYSKVDALRTYIRRNFSQFKQDAEIKSAKVLIYDLETSRATFKLFWTGKQYVSHTNMTKEPAIISVSWKWLGEDDIYSLSWDKKHSDRKLVKDFLKEFNKADMVIGINQDSFDNRWLAARAMKYQFSFNKHVKSFDVQKQAKRMFRLPSYSMKFLAQFTEVTNKQTHEGILMWEMVEDGTKEQQEEYMKKMVDYNIGDIITTEELYFRMRKYMKAPIHLGVLGGADKWACPDTGSRDVELEKTTITGAGTIQRIMKSNKTGNTYKISNTEYNKYLNREEHV